MRVLISIEVILKCCWSSVFATTHLLHNIQNFYAAVQVKVKLQFLAQSAGIAEVAMR